MGSKNVVFTPIYGSHITQDGVRVGKKWKNAISLNRATACPIPPPPCAGLRSANDTFVVGKTDAEGDGRFTATLHQNVLSVRLP